MMNLLNKYTYITFAATAGLMCLSSCDDNKMHWGKDPSHGEVTVAELPLPQGEMLERYDVLKSYLKKSDFKLGAGIGLDLYLNAKDTTSTLVNANFNDITIGYAMKHGAMVGGNGQLNFAKVDQLFQATAAAGISVYGHTLVWHQNQNASYLNSLIAPQVIPAPAGSNLLESGDFEFNDWNAAYAAGWNGWGGNMTKDVTDTEKVSGSKSLKVVSSSTGSNEWDTQVQSPTIDVIKGHRYSISFFIKSDIPGEMRVSFTKDKTDFMSNTYPWVNGASTIVTSASWQQVTYSSATIGNDWTATTDKLIFMFDLGKVPGVTYYIDNVVVLDEDAEPTEVNHVDNGDFEKGDLTGWSTPNKGAGIEVSADAKMNGSYGLKMVSSSSSANDWDLQATTGLALDATKTYSFSFWVKSDIAGAGRISFDGLDNNYPWMDWTGKGASKGFETSATWMQVSVSLSGAATKLAFDFGTIPDVTYFIDDVKVVEQKPATRALITRAGPTYIEKSDAEKTAIITEAMTQWINDMVGHCKAHVHAWDVVNEPMNDAKPSDVKTGKGKADIASDEFYWQDYLGGKDYAVLAFNLARAADPNALLFINDYNLEYNLQKCDGLINYVKYIEEQGAKVDGIGTQMHIAINSNKDNIVTMFQKLAATGKLIKISELDIKVNTKTPTAEQLQQQADMYRFVMEAYLKHIPAEQQYGITIWGLSDRAEEHVNWIPDDAPNLWDAKFLRKMAYKGVADGLAGRDVSEDFTGELQY